MGRELGSWSRRWNRSSGPVCVNGPSTTWARAQAPTDPLSRELPQAASTSPVSIFMDLFQLLSCNTKKMRVQTKHFWVEVGGKKGLQTLPAVTPVPISLTAPLLHLQHLILRAGTLWGSRLTCGRKYFTILREAVLKWWFDSTPAFLPPEKPGWKIKLINYVKTIPQHKCSYLKTVNMSGKRAAAVNVTLQRKTRFCH